jgi:NADPH:quinone reductase-like Zn-dependent oxidoreductase
MHAAVVHSFDRPPRYETVDPPEAHGADEVVVDVLAAGLHPRVRSGADGSHYTRGRALPLIPGIDGVGRTPDGDLLYFVLPDSARGSMAEQAVVDRRRCVALPADSDVATIAAAMNPGMSSWIALRSRIAMPPGRSVLVLGATGNAGRMAVEIARHLGAAHVVGAGRDAARLATLTGADVTVALGDDDALGAAAGDVDVVLDYLWGSPAERAIRAIVTHRRSSDSPLDWVQIGAVAGPDLALPSAALRAANLRVMGSGQGSVSTAAIVAELPALAAELTAGTFTVDAAAVPLSDVEAIWNAPAAAGRRIVFTP